MSYAYITLITGELYLPGVLTLGKVLRSYDPDHKLAVLADSAALSEELLQLISEIYDDVIDITDSVIVGDSSKVHQLLGRPELAVTFSKILLWSLTKYDKLVYLDADTLPIQSLGHLFKDYSPEHREVIASPDAGWPDIFNSGVLILKPLEPVFQELTEFVASTESFDGADQGILNEFFTGVPSSKSAQWKRLPFTYNVTPNTLYQYSPALKRFSKDIKIVHFIGAVKPWNTGGSQVPSGLEHHDLWWDHFNKHFPGELGAKILKRKGEAHNLQFGKTENAWEKDDTKSVVLDSGSIDDSVLPAVFPWEQKAIREPFRVFPSEK